MTTTSGIVEERLELHKLFSQDLMENPGIAPQLSDSHRVATIEIYAKGSFPDRLPDISTPHTDVYITRWEVKDPHDPFWAEHPDTTGE
jgi:hypothetical protein